MVGLPSFLVYSYYFWKKDCENNYYTGTKEKYRDQEFQRIVYKLNQPYLRSGIQSAFTNFSIFDRPYFEALFGNKQYPDGSYIVDFEDEFMEYQKAFMNVVSNIRSKNMMTFPVLTYSLLRQNGKFVDEDTAKWCCRHNMKWADSNFFISDDITSLSNCCFDGEQEVIVYKDGEKLFVKFKDLIPDEVYSIYSNRKWAKGKVVRLPAKKMYEIKVENKATMYTTFDHMFPVYGKGDKQVKDITDKDYLILDNTLEKADTVRVEYSKPSDKKYEWVYCFEMEDKDSPYFTLSNGIITHNCRLVSDVKNLG